MDNSKTIDFTHGNIVVEMVLFSIPIIIGETFQNLYHSVDALVVGNFVNKTALAAIGVCDNPANLLIGFFNGMSLGATVLVSNAFGSGDHDKLAISERVAFTFSLLLGVSMSAVSILCAPLLLKMTAVEADIYEQAILYLRVYLIGLMFTVIYNIGSGILRAVGDSRGPMVILVITCITNIVLDLLFVAAFHMGIVGAAVATIIAQFLSTVLIYMRLRLSNPDFAIDFHELYKARATIISFIKVGVPTGLQSSIVSFSNLFVWRYINSFSTEIVAGISVAQRLDKFVNLPGKALGMTMTTFVGQNIGSENYERNRTGLYVCLGIAVVVAGVAGVSLYASAGFFVSMFSRDEDVINVGVAMLRVIVPLYISFYFRETFAGVLRGYGHATMTTILTLVGMVGVRQIFLAVIMPIYHDVRIIYYAYPVGWISSAVFVFIYMCMKVRWNKPDNIEAAS